MTHVRTSSRVWRHAASGVAVAGIIGTSLVAATAAPALAAPDVEPRLTNFGFDAQSFGSKTSGNPNARSGATAVSFIPCTRFVPRSRSNFVAQAGDGDGVSLSNVQTNNFTRFVNGTTSVTSLVRIDGGTLAGGVVEFSNLRGRVKASNDGSGFDMLTASSLGSVSIAGTAVDLPVGDQQASFPVPGQGTLIVNRQIGSTSATKAAGAVNVLRFEGDDGTVEKTGRAFARMDSGIEGGLFGGGAWGSDAQTGELGALGRDPVQAMPCPGTRGEVLSSRSARGDTDLGFIGQSFVAAKGEQRSNRSAIGYTRAQIERAQFGALEFNNIKARANVLRQRDGDIFSNAKTTGVGTILVNGQEIQPPPPGEPQDVAGVGTFTVKTVTRDDRGIEVTAVTVVLENGTPGDTSDDTVVHLGNANLKIRRG